MDTYNNPILEQLPAHLKNMLCLSNTKDTRPLTRPSGAM